MVGGREGGTCRKGRRKRGKGARGRREGLWSGHETTVGWGGGISVQSSSPPGCGNGHTE